MPSRYDPPAQVPVKLPIVLAATFAAALAIGLASVETIVRAETGGWLPRWDLATHLDHGWYDYHLLATGQLPTLLVDLWEQGYWPPGFSIVQIPFFFLLGGGPLDGLWSGPAIFVVLAGSGALLLARTGDRHGPPAAAAFAALLLSSPYLLAYGTLAMTEILGGLCQLLVLLAYQRHVERSSSGTATAMAISLSALFFVKYNYFFLLAAPLAAHLLLERTRGWGMRRRLELVARLARYSEASRLGWLLAVYLLFLAVLTISGGFEFRLAGQRVSVRSIGSSGHIVLYLVLARVWYLHHRGRIDWPRLAAADPLVRPILLWLVVPIAIWLASPYPNHIRDLAALVINRPMGQGTVEAGLGAYVESLRRSYFYADWVLTLTLAAFAAAIVRYPAQSAVVRLVVLAVPIQFTAIALHHTRFTRFLLLTVVLMWVAAASEIGRWLASRRSRVVVHAATVLLLVMGVVAARQVVTTVRFGDLADEHYTRSEPLRLALASIRRDLTSEDRVVIVGQSNELSPALFRLTLGPPAGGDCYPFEIAGEDRLALTDATRVILLTPSGSAAPRDPIVHQQVRLDEVLAAQAERRLTPLRDFVLDDLGVTLRILMPTTPPARLVACRGR